MLTRSIERGIGRTSVRRVAAALAAGLLVCSGAATAAEVVAVKAGRVYTGDGGVIENGVVLIVDGKVQGVGAGLAIPADATIIDAPEASVTPGLVDACCMVDTQIPQSAQRFAFDSRFGEVRYAAHNPVAETKAPDTSLWTECIAQHEEQVHRFDPLHADDAPCCSPICAGPQTDEQIDALLAPGITARETWAEHAYEVVPHRRVIDSVNLFSNDFRRLLRDGVTTIYVSPDPASVIGERGAIVKTGGSLSDRIVNSEAAIRAALGGDPSRRGRSNSPPRGERASMLTRRPTTRMGVDLVFRKAFYDAIADGQGLALRGADTPPAEALPVLRQVLAGEIPLRVQARMQHDIFNALRLAQEFNLKIVIDEATEAYQALDVLRGAGVPIVYGPIFDQPSGFRRFSGEADDPRLTTAAMLHEAGIPFALTAQEMRDEEGLSRQAMMAIRYGLPADAALRAVTSRPAELLGVGDRLGTLKPGADGDLVVWNGEPFASESRATLVLIQGKKVFEN